MTTTTIWFLASYFSTWLHYRHAVLVAFSLDVLLLSNNYSSIWVKLPQFAYTQNHIPFICWQMRKIAHSASLNNFNSQNAHFICEISIYLKSHCFWDILHRIVHAGFNVAAVVWALVCMPLKLLIPKCNQYKFNKCVYPACARRHLSFTANRFK